MKPPIDDGLILTVGDLERFVTRQKYQLSRVVALEFGYFEVFLKREPGWRCHELEQRIARRIPDGVLVVVRSE